MSVIVIPSYPPRSLMTSDPAALPPCILTPNGAALMCHPPHPSRGVTLLLIFYLQHGFLAFVPFTGPRLKLKPAVMF